MKLEDLSENPIEAFRAWFSEAKAKSNLEWPEAMNLATVGADGRPHSRMVLLKGVSEDGFTFFTNFTSNKGQDLSAHPFAALCFHWESLGLQVRVEGRVEKLSSDESLAYFHTRARASQIGAWASPQSQAIGSREELEARVREMEERFAGEEKIPLPPYWGGFLVVPDRMEFWVNGRNRLHDRMVYQRKLGGEWAHMRLAP